MSNFAKSLLRDMVQKLLGIAFAWVGVHFIAIPPDVKNAVTNWAVLAVTAFLLLTWTAAVRWLESRHGPTQFDTYCRAVARILMLGVKGVPVYINPIPPPAVTTIAAAPTAPTATLNPDGTTTMNPS